jgi:hypothetical protein
MYYYCPKDWVTEEKITFVEGLNQFVLVPDATFTLEGKFYFVEIDRTQSMSDNKKKIELYGRLDAVMKKQYGYQPAIIFYTLTKLRQEKLKEYCKEKNLNHRIYTKEDIR